MLESRRRSVAKSLTWRVVATITTALVVFVSTRELRLTLEIAGIDTVVKMVSYYGHERVWARLRYGLGSTPDSSPKT